MKALFLFACIFIVALTGFLISSEVQNWVEDEQVQNRQQSVPAFIPVEENFEPAPPVIQIGAALEQAQSPLYTFGPNNDPGVTPAHLNMRDFGPPNYNLAPGELFFYHTHGLGVCTSEIYIKACSEGWPNGHYPLPQ